MLPEAFLRRMEKMLGEEYSQYLQSLERPRAVALRFNPLKGQRPALSFVGDSVPWEEAGAYYDPTARPGLHPYHDAGVYYLQEASAMSAVSLLSPQPGERVCDLCAAPGGKSTQIAGRMLGRGLLLCNEIHPKRAAVLSRNLERMGVGNALVTNETPQRIGQWLPAFFDRVLVDAPCSGEGMFRKEEAAVTDWSEETVAMCASRQQQILESAALLVRPGGRLVYSTCTFAPEENEQTVARFLQAHPEFFPQTVYAPWFSQTEPGCYRLWPHKLLGEGHFVAVLQKAGTEPGSEAAAAEKEPEQWRRFAQPLEITLPAGKPVWFGSSLYWTPPETPSMQGIRILRPGLHLGEEKKGRFEPAHALAMWLNRCTVSQDNSTEQIAAYLRGDVLPSDKTGWCLVTVDGYSVGWGKGDGRVLKNHYPKGLRKLDFT